MGRYRAYNSIPTYVRYNVIKARKFTRLNPYNLTRNKIVNFTHCARGIYREDEKEGRSEEKKMFIYSSVLQRTSSFLIYIKNRALRPRPFLPSTTLMVAVTNSFSI